MLLVVAHPARDSFSESVEKKPEARDHGCAVEPLALRGGCDPVRRFRVAAAERRTRRPGGDQESRRSPSTSPSSSATDFDYHGSSDFCWRGFAKRPPACCCASRSQLGPPARLRHQPWRRYQQRFVRLEGSTPSRRTGLPELSGSVAMALAVMVHDLGGHGAHGRTARRPRDDLSRTSLSGCWSGIRGAGRGTRVFPPEPACSPRPWEARKRSCCHSPAQRPDGGSARRLLQRSAQDPQLCASNWRA